MGECRILPFVMPPTVMLSAAKNPRLVPVRCHAERSEESASANERFFAALSMTASSVTNDSEGGKHLSKSLRRQCTLYYEYA